MNSSFNTHSRLALSDGIVVERLPLGFAAGSWWATFVYAAPGWTGREPPVDWRTLRRCNRIHDPDGRLEPSSGSGFGSEREFSQTWRLIDRGATRVVVGYSDDGEEVRTELLALDPADRDGYFSVRLSDGSLIERLPVGHANGMWRLRWVRSDVPRDELDAEMRGEDRGPVMLHQRFLRISSADGPLGPLDSSSSGIGAQFFAVQVPDTETDLRVEYVFESTSAGTEKLTLPTG